MRVVIIPAILAAIVLVAGMFAFMPVEKATTVHTTIQTNTNKIVRVTNTCTQTSTTAGCDGSINVDSEVPFVLLSVRVSGTGGDDGTLNVGNIVVNGGSTGLDPDDTGTGQTNHAVNTAPNGGFGEGAGTITFDSSGTAGTDTVFNETFTVDVFLLIRGDATTPVLSFT